MIPHRLFLTGVAATVIFLSASCAMNRKPMDRIGKVYNPATVETVKGEVVGVDLIRFRSGRGCGLELGLKTEKETVSIHLGPSWYADELGVVIEPKDKVEVTGSRMTRGDLVFIVAREVRKGDQVLKVRDENGTPLWIPHRAQ